jgi:hypothetical protein
VLASLHERLSRAFANAVSEVLDISPRHRTNLERSQKWPDVSFDAGYVASESAGLLRRLSSRQDPAGLTAFEIKIAELADCRGRPRFFLRSRWVATPDHLGEKP